MKIDNILPFSRLYVWCCTTGDEVKTNPVLAKIIKIVDIVFLSFLGVTFYYLNPIFFTATVFVGMLGIPKIECSLDDIINLGYSYPYKSLFVATIGSYISMSTMLGAMTFIYGLAVGRYLKDVARSLLPQMKTT